MTLLLEVLRTVELLADGPPELASEFATVGRLRTLARNQVVWRAGQNAESIVIAVTGELATLGRDSGGRGICYAFFGTGDCAGLPSALDGNPHPRELRVIRGGEFFFVDRATFLRFLDAHPPVRSRSVESVVQKFRQGLEERDREVFLPVHARVARFLVEHACVRRSDGARILIRETQPEIAIRLGSVREVIAREMASFGHQGLIRRTRHALFVVDWQGLLTKAACARGETRECTCEAETAALRTKRFFLPVLEGATSSVADESGVCGEYLAGFRACVARGCPLALAAPCGASLGPRKAVATPRKPSLPASPARSSPAVVARDSGDVVAGSPPSTDSAPRPASPRRAVRGRTGDDAMARVPEEDYEIRRRIDVYRRRAAEIESRSGGERGAPAAASVFRELTEACR